MSSAAVVRVLTDLLKPKTPVKKRVCGSCGGGVRHSRKVEEIDNPNYDKNTNPHVPKKITIQGLGTWHCIKGCGKRLVKVTRFVGSGKENELIGSGENRRPKEEYMQVTTVERHAKVLTSAA